MLNIKIKKTVFTFVSLVFFTSSPALAETVEEYIIKMAKGKIDSQMIHDEAKFLIFVGQNPVIINKTQVLEVARTQISMGVTTNILDFKIISKYQTGDIISVVSQIKARIKAGSTEIVSEQISHDILLKRNDSFVTVFSVAQQ